MAGGFWNYALEDPDALAVVDPDGTEHTAGEVLDAQPPGGARPAVARPEAGDTVAAVLPNGIEPDARVPRARSQAGLVLRADQLPALARPRSRTSSRTATPRRSSATSGSPTLVGAAADEAGIPAEARLAHGTDPGLPRRSTSSSTAQPTDAARRPHRPARRCTTRRARPAGPRA